MKPFLSSFLPLFSHGMYNSQHKQLARVPGFAAALDEFNKAQARIQSAQTTLKFKVCVSMHPFHPALG